MPANNERTIVVGECFLTDESQQLVVKKDEGRKYAMYVDCACCSSERTKDMLKIKNMNRKQKDMEHRKDTDLV